MEKITEYLQYHFTDPELLELAREQSRTIQEKGALERKKSEISKTLAGEIENKQGQIESLTERVSNGYEWRNIECVIHFDRPTPGMAQVIRTDTGDVVRERRMTAGELQLRIEFAQPEAEAEPPAEPEAEQPPPVEEQAASLLADGPDPDGPEWRTADEIRRGVPRRREAV